MRFSLFLKRLLLAKMIRFLLLVLFLYKGAFAAAPNFSAEHKFELKKDEWGIVRLTDLANKKVEEFAFCWRLYDWTNLNVQSFYRLYPRQHVLSLRQGGRSFIQSLRPATKHPPSDEVKLMISFTGFNSGVASFHAGVLDAAGRMSAEFIDPKR